MRQAIILHGMPSKNDYYDHTRASQSNEHWLPWLQRQLLLHEILAQTPEFPRPYEPDYALWSDVLEQFKLNTDTILIGHSCGAGFLVRWLSEHKVNIAKLILVAPWIDPEGTLKSGLFQFEIDPDLARRVGQVSIFNSDDDYADIQESVRILMKVIPTIKYREFKSYGHFCHDDMKTAEFPELLEEALG